MTERCGRGSRDVSGISSPLTSGRSLAAPFRFNEEDGVAPMNNPEVAYGADVLPHGIRSRFVDNGRGLRMHVLEAGRAGDPAVVLLHGFPELAFSWRKV